MDKKEFVRKFESAIEDDAKKALYRFVIRRLYYKDGAYSEEVVGKISPADFTCKDVANLCEKLKGALVSYYITDHTTAQKIAEEYQHGLAPIIIDDEFIEAGFDENDLESIDSLPKVSIKNGEIIFKAKETALER